MKSLVTGGAGFIGSNLVDQLLKIGHEVVVVDNEHSDAHDQFYWNPKAHWNVNGDIRDYDFLKNCMKGVDYVFHLAAEARIQPAIKNPIEAVSINAVGTCTVLQCARESGVKRVMYSSTSSAYGFNNTPNVESQPDDCLNPYSISKVTGEKLCKMYTDLYGLDTVIFRYFNVYGERQPLRGQYAPVIGIFLRQKNAGEPLTIVGDGEQRRDFTHVSDVVEANIDAMLCNFSGIEINIGTGKNTSVIDLANMIGGEIKYIPERPGEARETLASVYKAAIALNWFPRKTIEDYIHEELENTPALSWR